MKSRFIKNTGKITKDKILLDSQNKCFLINPEIFFSSLYIKVQFPMGGIGRDCWDEEWLYDTTSEEDREFIKEEFCSALKTICEYYLGELTKEEIGIINGFIDYDEYSDDDYYGGFENFGFYVCDLGSLADFINKAEEERKAKND